MGKLEKLREVNSILNEILIKKETYIFVENIRTEDKKSEKKTSDVFIEPKTIM